MRNFTTGATRNSDVNKLDYEGFLSPVVLEEFAIYMQTHRKQADGKLRESDNWQKGIPKEVYGGTSLTCGSYIEVGLQRHPMMDTKLQRKKHVVR
jgi:hypothetical protein